MSTKTVPRPSAVPAPPASVPDEERGVMQGSWNLYDRLTDAISERSSIRVAFDGRDIEIMTLGPIHERLKGCLDSFVDRVSLGLGIDWRGQGSTTWKRPELDRGIEADLSYYFDAAKVRASDESAARESNKVADYPNPDLVIEIDLSPSKIDRPGIYRVLQVPEVWRFRDEAMSIEQLGPGGLYIAAKSSRFLHVRPDEVVRWVTKENPHIRGEWVLRLEEWIRTELKPRGARS